MEVNKKIIDLDSTDVKQLCKNCSTENDECSHQSCPLWRAGECKAYLFEEIECIRGTIEHYFKDEKVKVMY